MKINGPNQPNFNPYQKQLNNQTELKKGAGNQDRIEISSQAKQMQEGAKVDPARQNYVNQIKQSVDNGEYKVDAQATAKKMIDFWSKQ
ncbi:flagellar biosynthesis anti-sigma factor FlgM [Thalassobacillus hwangdonensis]|uniref:Negative regulator of flagellin synthesis n=1 Tax=Thalassobacillus hwangdonensis TaxID=546108 RepID=A0ABW3L479_9BACI